MRRVLSPTALVDRYADERHGHRSAGLLTDEDRIIVARDAEPSRRLAVSIGGWHAARLPANATTAMRRFTLAAPATKEPPMKLPGIDAANLTDVTAGLTSNSTFAQYLGVALGAYTSISLRYRVTTAAATITWAEVGIATSPDFTVNTAPDLTTRGFTNVAATDFASTGQKTTAVSVSGIQPGDHLWGLWGNQATTIVVMRGALADDLQVGFFAGKTTTRPSTMAAATNFPLSSATHVPIWAAWQPSGGSPVLAASWSSYWYAASPGRIVGFELANTGACTAGTVYPQIVITDATGGTRTADLRGCEINSTSPTSRNASVRETWGAAGNANGNAAFELGARLQPQLVASSGFLPTVSLGFDGILIVEYDDPAA